MMELLQKGGLEGVKEKMVEVFHKASLAGAQKAGRVTK